uniref:Uncharacterized protein n=1 Tax=Heterorhabditis bacteriophora TaxID=37862 RepID=A0A1I7XET2_HETBA
MIRKATTVALSPSVANLLTAQRMLDLEEPLVKSSKKYPFFKTPRIGSRRIRNRLVQKQRYIHDGDRDEVAVVPAVFLTIVSHLMDSVRISLLLHWEASWRYGQSP